MGTKLRLFKLRRGAPNSARCPIRKRVFVREPSNRQGGLSAGEPLRNSDENHVQLRYDSETRISMLVAGGRPYQILLRYDSETRISMLVAVRA